MILLKKDVELQKVPIYMTDTDGNAATGKTLTIKISENGGSFADGAGGTVEVYPTSYGIYYYVPAASEVDTLAYYTIKASAIGCLDTIVNYQVVPANLLEIPAAAGPVEVGSFDVQATGVLEDIVGNITADLLDSRSFTAESMGKMAANAYKIESMIDDSGEDPKWSEDSLSDISFPVIIDANVTQIAGDTTAATNLSLSAGKIIPGTALTGSTTTSIVTDLVTTVPDEYENRTIYINKEAKSITAYNESTKTLTVEALKTAPTNGTIFVIM